jgi:hypothetical protein
VIDVDWAGIRNWLLGELGKVADIRVASEEDVEMVVNVHGWEALGAVIQAVMEEKKIRVLVDYGVPFDEAAKIAGFREVNYSSDG